MPFDAEANLKDSIDPVKLSDKVQHNPYIQANDLNHIIPVLSVSHRFLCPYAVDK